MAKISKLIIRTSLLLALVWMIYSCANQLGPQGGDVDKIPPDIIYTYPANKTVNYKENYIEIEFSEYVDKRTVQESIFISPYIDGKIEYNWGGTSVEIIFEDSLRKNITYTVTIGTDVIDLNNRNKMSSAFSYTFSTGPEIDYCSISGKVYEKDPTGTFLFAYQVADTVPNPITQKPHYISQTGKDGKYKILGMAPGKYRVFAINDSFRDLFYNPGDDRYGCPHSDVILSKQDSSVSELDFKMTIEDTTEAHISNITMTDRNHILVEFTESIDSSRLAPANFVIIDSTTVTEHQIKYLYKGKNKPGNYFIAFADSLIEENNNYLVVQNIFDKSGNELEKESSPFVVATRPDTAAAMVQSIDTEYPQKVMDFLNPYLIVNFDDAIDSTMFSKSVTMIDKANNSLNFQIAKVDDASFKLYLTDKLKSGEEIEFKLDYNSIFDSAGNTQDTSYTAKFNTINELEFSGLSGLIKSGKNNTIVQIQNLSAENVIYTQLVDSAENFNFARVRPGNYLLFSFIDENNNNKFDFGKITPIIYSENFKYYPDTIKLAPRWPVGDLSLGF